jgi:hypothetical protein
VAPYEADAQMAYLVRCGLRPLGHPSRYVLHRYGHSTRQANINMAT